MAETRQQITQRKIRNGLRKQAEAVQRGKEKIWDILKTDLEADLEEDVESDDPWTTTTTYSPYMPIHTTNIIGGTTA